MTQELRWRVWRSRFPVSAPTELLGYVSAPTYDEAWRRATSAHGDHIAVERCTRVPPLVLTPEVPEP